MNCQITQEKRNCWYYTCGGRGLYEWAWGSTSSSVDSPPGQPRVACHKWVQNHQWLSKEMHNDGNKKINSYAIENNFLSGVTLVRNLDRFDGFWLPGVSREAGVWTQRPSLGKPELLFLGWCYDFSPRYPSCIVPGPWLFFSKVIQSYRNAPVLFLPFSFIMFHHKRPERVPQAIQ